MTDPKVTKEIQDWLLKDPKTNDMALPGALLLQRLNPRNMAYRRWLSVANTRPMAILAKIEYEMKKHLRYRLDGLTLEEVRRLDQKVVPEAEHILSEGEPEKVSATVNTEGADSSSAETDGSSNAGGSDDQYETVKKLGKREDHDQLPDSIKQLWVENGETYKKIKALFEELKSMENLPSCDRYEKLQILASLDAGYLKKMETYDNYVIGSDAAQDTTEAETTKKIGSARSYLSKNIDKLAELKSASEAETATDADKEAYAALLDKLQQRLDILISASAPITDELKAKYESLGLKTQQDENTDDSDSSEAAE